MVHESPPDWDALAAGEDCPFDAPRVEPNDYWDTVCALDISTLCLLTNQAYRGHCILIFDARHAIRPDQLSFDEWSAWTGDLYRCTQAVVRVCKPDHINVESMGNVVPHLHWQIIPRYRDDGRWGAPIWTTTTEELAERRLDGEERADLIERLRVALEQRA